MQVSSVLSVCMDVHGWLKLLGISTRAAYLLFVSILTLAWLAPTIYDVAGWAALRVNNAIPFLDDRSTISWADAAAPKKPLEVLVSVSEWLEFTWAVDKLSSAASWFARVFGSGEALSAIAAILVFGSFVAYIIYLTQDKTAPPTALSSGWLGVAILAQGGTRVGIYLVIGVFVYLVVRLIIAVVCDRLCVRTPRIVIPVDGAMVSFFGAALLGHIWVVLVLYS